MTETVIQAHSFQYLIEGLQDYEYPQIAERFYRETRDHELTILKDDGLYRHLRMKPKGHSFYWYDIVTWPGNLVFRGDGESYVFTRLEDMFQFFRTGIAKNGKIHINPSYWAEKLTSDQDGVKKFDEESFRQVLQEQVDQAIENEDFTEDEVKEFKAELQEEIFDSYVCADEHEAYSAVERFQFFFGPKDKYGRQTKEFTFEEPWEWFGATKEYNWWLLWAMYGIAKAIQEYDKVSGHSGPVDVATAGQVVTIG